MHKKLYHVSLDPDKVQPVQEWLKKNGMTFSGYINVIIGEISETIRKLEEQKESTVRTCANLFADSVEALDKVKKEMKEKPLKKRKVKE